VGVRRDAREQVLQALYAIELNPASAREALRLFWEGARCSANVRIFADELISGLLANKAEVDAKITEKSPNWSINRMGKIDLSIIRIAAYELLFRPDIPKNVTINEAIEVAKKFGTEESPAFVNGIVDEIARSVPDKP
jgi:N utilization substance protein B